MKSLPAGFNLKTILHVLAKNANGVALRADGVGDLQVIINTQASVILTNALLV